LEGDYVADMRIARFLDYMRQIEAKAASDDKAVFECHLAEDGKSAFVDIFANRKAGRLTLAYDGKLDAEVIGDDLASRYFSHRGKIEGIEEVACEVQAIFTELGLAPLMK
jgi:hypothetical protein